MSGETTELRDRLERLADALPPHGSVTLTRSDLIGMLGREEEQGGEPDTIADLTVEDIAAELDKAESTVRGWAPKIPGAYKLGREWRVPRAAFRRWLDAQARGGDQAGSEGSGAIDLGSWRKHIQEAD